MLQHHAQRIDRDTHGNVICWHQFNNAQGKFLGLRCPAVEHFSKPLCGHHLGAADDAAHQSEAQYE
jgi:hypothetical protein